MGCGIVGTFLGFVFRCGAFASAALPTLVAGHYILLHLKQPGYADASLKSSMAVGALGGCLMTAPMMLFYWLVEQLQPLAFKEIDPESGEEENSPQESEGKRKQGRRSALTGLSIPMLVLQFLLMVGGVVGLGAGSGTIGAAILRATHHHTLPVLLATRAGAIGAAILGPGALVLVLLLSLCCGGPLVLALLWSKRRSKKEPATDNGTVENNAEIETK